MYTDLVLDYEVYEQDYQEEQQILKELNVLETIETKILDEYKKDSPKWARLCREHLPTLREIYYNGDLQDEAQKLIAELLDNTTTPLNDLEMAYDEVDGVYQELDSYTGEPIAKYEKREHDWDLDYLDTQALIGLDDPASELFGKMLDDLRPEFNVVIPSFDARLIEELKKLGYSDKEIEGALDANKYDVYTDEPDSFYENDFDPLPSVPLQMEAEDMKVEPGSMIEFRSLIEPELKALFDLRAAFFENDSIKYKKLAYWMSILNRSHEKADYLDRLQKLIDDGWETQYAAVSFLSFEGDWGLSADDDARVIHVPILGTLDIFIDAYADEILEQLYSGIGNHGCTTESTIDLVADQFIEEILEKQFVESGRGINPLSTQNFARGVFDAVASGKSNLTEAGWDSYYHGVNAAANKIRNKVFKKFIEESKDWSKAQKASKDAFWNASQIVKITKDKLLISNLITGKARWIDYDEAAKLAIESKLVPRNKQKLIAGLDKLKPVDYEKLVEAI
jgi:hypothetical protein